MNLNAARQVHDVKEWWDEHPMNYQGYEKKRLDTDEDYKAFFNTVDEAWRKSTMQINSPNALYFGDRLLDRNRVAGRRVLEIGCGMGTWTQAFAEWGCDVTSIDLTRYAVEMTKKRLKLAGLEAEVLEMDAAETGLPDNGFDFIWSWGVIHHSPHTEQIAKEIHRLLKPGGEFGIMVYYKYSIHSMYVLFRLGLLRGELFRYGWQGLQARYSEGIEYGGPPLARSWSRRGFRKLLAPLIPDRIRFHSPREAAFMLLPSCIGLQQLAERVLPIKVKDSITGRFGHGIYAYGHKRP